MVGLVKSFQFFQKCQSCIGITPFHPDETRRSIIAKRTILLFGNAVFVIPTAAYLVFAAQTMFEYGMAVFISITVQNSVALYLLLIWQSENTLKFFETCEEFTAKSKCENQQLRRIYISVAKLLSCQRFFYFSRSAFDTRLQNSNGANRNV